MELSFRLSYAVSKQREIESAVQVLFEKKVLQDIKIELRLYIDREEELLKLYIKAIQNGNLKTFNKHGFSFDYVLIQKKDVPQYCKNLGSGFSHCLYSSLDALVSGKRYALANGLWLIFVVQDNYPGMTEDYLNYVALHEYGEAVTLGNHALARKLEIWMAEEDGKLVEYYRWYAKYYPHFFEDVLDDNFKIVTPQDSQFFYNREKVGGELGNKLSTIMERHCDWPFWVLAMINKIARKKGLIQSDI